MCALGADHIGPLTRSLLVSARSNLKDRTWSTSTDGQNSIGAMHGAAVIQFSDEAVTSAQSTGRVL